MLALVSLLPVAWQPKAKAIVAALGTILTVIVTVTPVLPDWAPAVLTALTTLGVYATPAPGYVPPLNAAHRRP